jgi:hypothetical protein
VPDRPQVLLCTSSPRLPAWVPALPARLHEVDVTRWHAPGWEAPAGRGTGGPFLPLVDDVLRAAAARPFSAGTFVAALAAVAAAARDADLAGALASPAVARRTSRPALPWLARLLAPLAADLPPAQLVHVAGMGWAAGPAVLAAADRGVPLLVSDGEVFVREQVRAVEGAGVEGDARRVAVELVVALARAAYAQATHVTAACHYVARWQEELGAAPAHMEVVPEGVDPAAFPAGTASSARRGGPTVVQVSAIEAAADTIGFLEAAALVRARRPSIRFVHYGPVADAAYAALVEGRRQALGLSGAVELAGEPGGPGEPYRDADVVCLTTAEGGYPYAAVEALMSGRPLVCTDTGGTREVVGRAGVLVPAGDPQAMADALERVLASPHEARAAMAAEGRERALVHFNLDATVAAYRRLYDRLLRAPTRAPARPTGDGTGDEVATARSLAATVTGDPDPARREAAVAALADLLARPGGG